MRPHVIYINWLNSQTLGSSKTVFYRSVCRGFSNSTCFNKVVVVFSFCVRCGGLGVRWSNDSENRCLNRQRRAAASALLIGRGGQATLGEVEASPEEMWLSKVMCVWNTQKMFYKTKRRQRSKRELRLIIWGMGWTDFKASSFLCTRNNTNSITEIQNKTYAIVNTVWCLFWLMLPCRYYWNTVSMKFIFPL